MFPAEGTAAAWAASCPFVQKLLCQGSDVGEIAQPAPWFKDDVVVPTPFRHAHLEDVYVLIFILAREHPSSSAGETRLCQVRSPGVCIRGRLRWQDQPNELQGHRSEQSRRLGTGLYEGTMPRSTRVLLLLRPGKGCLKTRGVKGGESEHRGRDLPSARASAPSLINAESDTYQSGILDTQ